MNVEIYQKLQELFYISEYFCVQGSFSELTAIMLSNYGLNYGQAHLRPWWLLEVMWIRVDLMRIRIRGDKIINLISIHLLKIKIFFSLCFLL